MTGRTGAPWTDADIQQLRELFEAGATNPEITAKLGRTYASIRNKASDLGLYRIRILGPTPKPAARTPPPQPTLGPKEKRCLTCMKPFISAGPHNRLCGHCRTLSYPF